MTAQTPAGYVELKLSYEDNLRRLYEAIDRLDAGFTDRARSWTTREWNVQSRCPSLELFLDHALLEECAVPGVNSLLGAAPRFMCEEEEDNPYGQIAILSDYSRTPVPGCYFSFEWHDEIDDRPEELREIADDFYFWMRQLAPAIARALTNERVRF